MQNTFQKTLLATAAATLIAGAAHAEIKVGVILGFTGPIESLTPTMADSAELAFAEASNSGLLLGGETITAVRADSTCVDASAATAAAERLVNSDSVVAIMGADLPLQLLLALAALTTTVYSSVQHLLMHAKVLY
jgi:branched-chain amino acid transport system substrate-binding protein